MGICWLLAVGCWLLAVGCRLCWLFACGKISRVLGDVLAVIGHALQAQEHFDKNGSRLGLAGAGVIPFLVPLPGLPDETVDPVFPGKNPRGQLGTDPVEQGNAILQVFVDQIGDFLDLCVGPLREFDIAAVPVARQADNVDGVVPDSLDVIGYPGIGKELRDRSTVSPPLEIFIR